MAKPYAVLSHYNTHSLECYIRLNGEAARLLNGKPLVSVKKTADNKYIVLTPVDMNDLTEMCRRVRLKGKREKSAYVFVTQWVNTSFFVIDWFCGAHYKVKKDRHGRIYICLNEVIDERKE